jgi:HD-GYP domain-containing protein (c-di-GMP phosphodiesterase class II)
LLRRHTIDLIWIIGRASRRIGRAMTAGGAMNKVSGRNNSSVIDLNSEMPLASLERDARSRIEKEVASDHAWFDQTIPSLLCVDSMVATQLHVDVLFLFVQWYFKEGRFDTAQLACEKAVQLSRALGQAALLRRALNLLGATYSRIGNFPFATVCHVEALQIAEAIGDSFGKAAVIANLAEARFNAGLIAESIFLNRYVIEALGDEPHHYQLAAGSHHNIAVASLLLDDIEIAHQEITQAIQLCGRLRNQFWAHQNVVFETTYSKILLRLGNIQAAQQRAERASELALRLNSGPARTIASLALILCEAAAGDPNASLNRLELIRPTIDRANPAYRDFLEVQLHCSVLAGHPKFAEHIHARHLLHLAQHQRTSTIQQIAAFQRCIRTLGASTEYDLRALPPSAKARLLNSSLSPTRNERVRNHLEAIASLAGQREDGTAEHSIRVGRLVELYYAGVGKAPTYAADMAFAARLHDIGKIATPDVLLLKRSKLTPTEIGVIRRHTTEGCQILSDILGYMEQDPSFASAEEIQTLRHSAEIAQNHHEWWDGSGYPRGTGGAMIPESARICSLADVFDGLTGTRPYKVATSTDEALTQISKLSGRQFDPQLCASFTDVLGQARSQYGNEFQAFVSVDQDLSPYQIANRVIDRIVESVKGARDQQHHGRVCSSGFDHIAEKP